MQALTVTVTLNYSLTSRQQPSCSHDTPDYDEVSLYQVCLQKVQQFKRYCLEFFHVQCDLEHNDPIFSLDTFAYDNLP